MCMFPYLLSLLALAIVCPKSTLTFSNHKLLFSLFFLIKSHSPLQTHLYLPRRTMEKYETKVVYDVKKNVFQENVLWKLKKKEDKPVQKYSYKKGVLKNQHQENIIIENIHAEFNLKQMNTKADTPNQLSVAEDVSRQTEVLAKNSKSQVKSPSKLMIPNRDKVIQEERNKHVAIRNRKRNLPKFIILHYSPFKAVWDWIVLLLVLYTAVFTPYTTAFLLNENKTKAQLNKNPKTRTSSVSDNQAGPLVIIDLIVDVIFIADILINFRTTYVHSGEVISDPQKIARNYIRGWFLLDACAAIPFDLVVFGSSGSTDTMTSTGVLKTARLLRLLRVARRIHQYSEYGAAMMLFLMATFTLVAHWLACIFYVIAHYEREVWHVRVGWLDTLAREYKQPYIENSTDSLSLGGPKIESKYITSLYFVFTAITSIGFGNVAPNTNAEKVFCIFAMLAGSMMSAAIFGNVSSIMLRLYQGSEECHERRSSIKEFIKFHRIPKHLAKRLQDSFQTNWDYTNGININMILRAFPECLQADICLHMNRTLLNTCPAFRGASAGCLRAFALRFRTTHIPPGDMFIHPGDLLDSVYFISRGSIEIIYFGEQAYQERVIMGILNKHDIFGGCPKEFLQNKISQSKYGVHAVGFVDLNRITLIDLKDILFMYPEWSTTFLNSFQITFKLNEIDKKLIQKPTILSNNELLNKASQIQPNPNLQWAAAKPISPLLNSVNANSSDVQRDFRHDLGSVIDRMQDLNSRAKEMEKNYQAAFSEILQLLTTN